MEQKCNLMEKQREVLILKTLQLNLSGEIVLGKIFNLVIWPYKSYLNIISKCAKQIEANSW